MSASEAGGSGAGLDFTGEQVVKGVTPDRIWQDHFARYEHALPAAVGKRVLDVACGTGYGAHHLATGGAHGVDAVDISAAVIASARQRYHAPALRFHVGSILDLQFPDATFDLVTCFETIEHLDDPDRALREIRRVLKADGTLLISTPNRPVTSPLKGLHDPPNNKYHVREWTVPEFRALLARHFVVGRAFGQRLRPRPLYWRPVYVACRSLRLPWYGADKGTPVPRALRWYHQCRYVLFECRIP